MNEIQKSRINDLNFTLIENELVTEHGLAIKFFDADYNEDVITGKMLIDYSKTGVYKIIFSDKLTLLLTSTSNFKFFNHKDYQVNSIAISGIDSDSIITLIRNLIITNV